MVRTMPPTAEEILRRALDARVSEVLPQPTPLERAPRLSRRYGRDVYIKREDLTPIFSFKLRGAYNKIANLPEAERARGVIAASAGNHAQGVALSAGRLGCPCRIVMPRSTPSIKIEAVRDLGAEVDLIGDGYAEAAEHAAKLARETGMVAIHPYDDVDVIAGQGTIGVELLRQAPRHLDAVLVPVGGGGLAAGVAAVLGSVRPQVAVFGVEPEDSDAMAQSLERGERVVLPNVGIFADGVAVKQVGEKTFALCQRHLAGSLRVANDAVCAAMRDAFEELRVLLEPAGALAIAGLDRLVEERPGEGAIVVVASGANVNFSRLGYVAERTELGDHREALFSVTIPEQPGAFLEFCELLGGRSVTEFNYRLGSRREAHIFVGLAVSGPEEAAAVRDVLAARYASCDLSQDEIAKIHVRHMVGGRSTEVEGERLFRFAFPEYPGALLRFLRSLGARWNISLFHYRNHGAAYGDVLCGFEVPENDAAHLRGILDQLGYVYGDVTENPACRSFLGDA